MTQGTNDSPPNHEHYFQAGVPDVMIEHRKFRYFRCECGEEYGSEMFGDSVPADLSEDAADWPDGHPCRDCGRLYRDHSPDQSDCQGWR